MLAVGGGAGVEHRTAVLHVLHVVDGGLGEAKEAWRSEPVVEVLVPLVSEQPLEEQRDAKPSVAEGTVGVRDCLGAGSGRGERMVGAPGGAGSGSWRTRRAK